MIPAASNPASASSTTADRAQRPDSEQLAKPLDSGSKGQQTVDDLQAAVVKISAEGARQAEAAAPAAPSAQGVPAKSDGDGDGKVTERAVEAAEPKAQPTAGGGAAPAGAQAPAGGSVAGLASSTKTYEPADANEDGKVSAQEQQAYEARLAAEKATQAAASAGSPGAQAAVKAYEAVEQLGQAGA